MALMTPQSGSSAGITPVFSAVSSSDTVKLTSNALLVIKVGGTATTITISTYPDTTSWGATIPDLVFTAISNAERWVTLKPESFANPATGIATITYSQTTAVTSGLFLL